MGKHFSVWERLYWYRKPILAGLYIGFIFYAIQLALGAMAVPATTWMRVFPMEQFENWPKIGAYFLSLRTGVPPFISFLEVLFYKAFGSWNFILQDIYQKCMIMMLLLPVLFSQRSVKDMILCLVLAWIFLQSILLIHPGNPQVYDVLLPFFIITGLVFANMTLQSRRSHRARVLYAILAGFMLAQAELARPFMLALLPLILIWLWVAFRKHSKRYFVYLMIPILLISGGWHLKLLIFNQGQLIWSNHGGTNLYQAWNPLVDHEEMNPLLLEEAPPIFDNGWAWKNINTQIHAENSKIRQRAVVKGIKKAPLDAWDRFYEKAEIFTEPQTAMYEHKPEASILEVYRFIVHFLFYVLAFMLIRAVWMVVRKPQYLWSTECLFVGITAFLTLMPIIGESGEEARFLISVLPFLSLMALFSSDIAING